MTSKGRRMLLVYIGGVAVFLGIGRVSYGAAAPAVKTEVPAPPVVAPPVVAAPSDKDWTDDWKQPTKWFKWGADERIRQEYLHNPFYLDVDPPGHEYNNLRVRSRIWGTISPCDYFDFNIRLTNEARYWWAPESKPGDLKNASGDWDYSDVLFDNLNFKFKNLFETKSTLTIGRQDFLTPQGAPSFGDGWLVLDGTPLDGSRTVYFDAVRLNVDLEKCNTSVDVVFINQYSDPDAWLPPINSESSPALMEQDERGVVLYARNKSIDKTQIDGYFIYKHDDPQLGNGDEGDVYTVGSRVGYEFNANLKGSIEGAYQFGNRSNPAMFGAQDSELSAWGMNSRLTYSFNDDLKNRVWVGMEMLSGDDADGGTNGQFDPLWGRWPQWSELYIYPYATETRIAETTNVIHPQVGWGISPMKGMDVTATYHPLWAFENTRHDQGAAGSGFDDGSMRGHLFTAILKYKFNKHVGMHLWTEYFIAGDYYETVGPRNEDDVAFVRWEMYFTF